VELMSSVAGEVECGGNRGTYYFGGKIKPDTGDPLHTQEPVTVASFRTWRDWREDVA
jgi:hypothetical protein